MLDSHCDQMGWECCRGGSRGNSPVVSYGFRGLRHQIWGVKALVLPAISERTLEAEAEPLAQFGDLDNNLAHLRQAIGRG